MNVAIVDNEIIGSRFQSIQAAIDSARLLKPFGCDANAREQLIFARGDHSGDR